MQGSQSMYFLSISSIILVVIYPALNVARPSVDYRCVIMNRPFCILGIKTDQNFIISRNATRLDCNPFFHTVLPQLVRPPNRIHPDGQLNRGNGAWRRRNLGHPSGWGMGPFKIFLRRRNPCGKPHGFFLASAFGGRNP